MLQVFLCASASDAMDMPHYDINSLVYMSTDIVIANLSEDGPHKFTASVTETLRGSLRPSDRLDTLSPFLTYFRPMEDGMRLVLFLDRRPRQYDFLHSDAAKSPFAVPPSGVLLSRAVPANKRTGSRPPISRCNERPNCSSLARCRAPDCFAESTRARDR